MDIATLVISIVSAAAGWTLRHYGIFAPGNAAPQSSPARGTMVVPPPVEATWREELRGLLRAEITAALQSFRSDFASPAKGS